MDGGVNIELKSAMSNSISRIYITLCGLRLKLIAPRSTTPPPTIESSDKFPIYPDATSAAPGCHTYATPPVHQNARVK